MADQLPPKSLTARKPQVPNKASLPSSPSAAAEDSGISTPEVESKSYSIWFSNVVVTRPKNLFLNRKWNSSDIGKLSFFIMIHGLAMCAPFTYNWGAIRVFFLLSYVIMMYGVTLSFHRNLSHRSFTLPKWLEYFFAYIGVLALQGDPITWVSAHRNHHKYVDTEKDPHSPFEGFWFSHINWVFDTGYIVEKRGEQTNVDDLKKQTFYMFVKRTYLLHSFGLGLLLYALGGFPYVVWGMGVRFTLTFHGTSLVNSACHVWGYQSWNTGDLSKNNCGVGLFLLGEGWHNNHHAFEYSARHGLEWWQFDGTWYTIKFLEALGLATDVKLPTEAHKQRLAFKSEAKNL